MVLRDLSDQNIATALERDLDHGEAQAIALALQFGQPIVLIDEHEGRSIAKTMALRPVGVLGILLRAKVLGHISEIKPNFSSFADILIDKSDLRTPIYTGNSTRVPTSGDIRVLENNLHQY